MSHSVATAQAVRERAEHMAAGLVDAGCVDGDRVVVSVPNSADIVAVVWACVATGLIAVPLDPRLTSAERDPIIAEVEPRLVLADPAALAGLASTESSRELDEFPRSRPMHFTSGTTGRPKGVWSGFWSAEHARAAALEERQLWGFEAGDVNLVVSPLHHSAPLRFALGTVLAGGSLVVLPTFSVEGFVAAVRDHAPTTMFCVPTHLQRLLAADDLPDVSSFRLVAHAGAPCPEPVRRGAHAWFGTDVVWEFYGSTEGQFTACRAEDWQAHPGTVGRARPGRTMSADADGQLWCAVPPWARFEYWRDAERTAESWRTGPQGPEFTVGDLGRIDDGWVYLDARRTDLIISGGVNVYPAEVEAVLETVPGVVEVAVFGRADDQWGQRVCAAWVGEATESQLRAAAEIHLAPPKRPKTYDQLDALPRTPSGKVKRTEL